MSLALNKQSALVGGVIGLTIAGALALTSVLPPVLAQEEPMRTLLRTGDELTAESFEGSDLLKPDWTVEPFVSTEVLSEQTVRKISYGRTEFVRIATTKSGTYSTDAVADPRIRYPGMHAENASAYAALSGFEGLLGLWDGKSWVVIKGFIANSFVNVVPFDGGRTFVHDGGLCVTLKDDSVHC